MVGVEVEVGSGSGPAPAPAPSGWDCSSPNSLRSHHHPSQDQREGCLGLRREEGWLEVVRRQQDPAHTFPPKLQGAFAFDDLRRLAEGVLAPRQSKKRPRQEEPLRTSTSHDREEELVGSLDAAKMTPTKSRGSPSKCLPAEFDPAGGK